MAMESEITETKPHSTGAQWWIAAVLSALVAQNANGNGGGLLGGILGGGNPPPPPPPGMEPVSQKILDLTAENQRLRSEQYTDRIAAAQGVLNATQSAQIACLEKQVDHLYGLTKLVVPNGNVSPGWGPVDILAQAAASATSTTNG
jgi:hypothetical protein